jgi:hypothetical protein
MDDRYERMRVRALEAIADHERGELDDAGLQSVLARLGGTLDNAHEDVRQALFEADVALEYAQHGHPVELGSDDPDAAMKRMRRNLREALGWY